MKLYQMQVTEFDLDDKVMSHKLWWITEEAAQVVYENMGDTFQSGFISFEAAEAGCNLMDSSMVVLDGGQLDGLNDA